MIPRKISTIRFQFLWEHTQEIPWPTNYSRPWKLQFYTSRPICFWNFFQVMGKISRLSKICKITILVSRFDLAEKISTNWFLVEKEKFPLKLLFCCGMIHFDKCVWKETAEILLILCKKGVSENIQESNWDWLQLQGSCRQKLKIVLNRCLREFYENFTAVMFEKFKYVKPQKNQKKNWKSYYKKSFV